MLPPVSETKLHLRANQPDTGLFHFLPHGRGLDVRVLSPERWTESIIVVTVLFRPRVIVNWSCMGIHTYAASEEPGFGDWASQPSKGNPLHPYIYSPAPDILLCPI